MNQYPPDLAHLLGSVKEQSPWLDPNNREWFVTDGALRDVIEAENKGLYEPPKSLFYLENNFTRPLFRDPKQWGTLIVLGPRRVGKTSTLKYMIKRLIDEGVSRESFIYITLDLDELLRELEKKRLLREFIGAVIDYYKKPDKPLLIVLDEVTFYFGWARAIKNLIDSGKLGPGIGLIATGSYSMELSSAKRELSGRYGPLGERMKGEIFFYPRRFIEVAESVLGPDFRKFVSRNFGKFPKRMGILEYLAGFQTEANGLLYNYKTILQNLMDNHYDALHGLFENIYIYAGGFPRAIYEAIITQREGAVNISDARFRDDIFNLLVTDCRKFNLSEETMKGILSKISLPIMQVSSDYKTLTEMRKEDAEKFVNYLTTSGLVSFLPNVSSPRDIDFKSLLVSPQKTRLKLVLNDPCAFFAMNLCSRGATTGILSRIDKVLENKEMKEHLFESIVLSHLHHIPVIKVSASENVGYVLDIEDGKERELADGFCWYISHKSELVLIAVEAKHVEKKLDLNEIEERAKILKEKYGVKKLIVVTNQKQVEIKEDYSIVPIEVFISLM